MLQSPVDIALIAGVVLLIFGPKKLPEMGKALGLGIGNFKRSLTEAQDEVKTALHTEPNTSSAPVTPVQATTAAPVNQTPASTQPEVIS